MTTENTQNNADTSAATTETPALPLGAWLRTVDRLLARELRTAFEAEGATRRDWRILSALNGDSAVPGFAQRVPGRKPRALADRGWITQADGAWALTDEGRAARARLRTGVDGVRAKIAAVVTEDEYATTMATLEAIARALGWDEAQPVPRGGRRGRSAGRGFGRGRGAGRGRGFDRDRRYERDEACGQGEGYRAGDAFSRGRGFGRGDAGRGYGRGDGNGRGGRGFRGAPEFGARPGGAEQAYARGFDAGFARGRAS